MEEIDIHLKNKAENIICSKLAREDFEVVKDNNLQILKYIENIESQNKQLLETIESLKNKIHNWRELDSSGHYDTLRDVDEIISLKVGE